MNEIIPVPFVLSLPNDIAQHVRTSR